MVLADPLRFAAAARLLAAEARLRGLRVPGFRSPPRLPESDRTLRRGPAGEVIVAVTLRGRSLEAVVSDMVEGILLVNPNPGIGSVAEHRQALVDVALVEEGASAA